MIQKTNSLFTYLRTVRNIRRAFSLTLRLPLIKEHVRSVTLELVRRGYSYKESLAMVKNSREYKLFQKEKKGWGKHKNRKYYTLCLYYHDTCVEEFADYILEDVENEQQIQKQTQN